MRGRILQYNGSDGTGIIVIDGQQHPFAIAAWKGDSPPAVGKTVDVELADGAIRTVTLVGDDVLLREKTAELTGKLSGMVGGLAKSAGGSAVGGSIVARYGKPLLIAYGVFLIASLFFHFIAMEMLGMKQGRPLWDLSTQLSQTGGGGGVKLLVLLAYVSIAVPFVWPDKRAWLTLLLPALAVLWAYWSVHRTMGPMSELFSYGIGFYLCAASALYLAFSGVRRFLSGG